MQFLREPDEDIPAPRPAESKRSPWPSSPGRRHGGGGEPRGGVQAGPGRTAHPQRAQGRTRPVWIAEALRDAGGRDGRPGVAADLGDPAHGPERRGAGSGHARGHLLLADPPKAPPVTVRGQIHAEPPAPVARPRVVKPRAHVAAPLRIRPTERSKPVTLPAERPVARPAPAKHRKAKKPAKQTRSHSSSRFPKPVVVVQWLWPFPTSRRCGGCSITAPSRCRTSSSRAWRWSTCGSTTARAAPASYLSVRPSAVRSTWTVSPSWISPASSARASLSPIAVCTRRRSGRAP